MSAKKWIVGIGGAGALAAAVWSVVADKDERSCYQNGDGQMVLVDTVPLETNPSQNRLQETILPEGNTWRITSDGKCTDGERIYPQTPRELRGPADGLNP